MASIRPRVTRPRSRWFESTLGLSLYFGANVALAFSAKASPAVATAWALATLLAGLVAVIRPLRWDRVAVVMAHAVGAELIWRGTHAWVFWEFGKYMTILLIVLSLLLQRAGGRVEIRGALIVLCMIPGLLALDQFDRTRIAFNISGPVALGLSVLFFSGRLLTQRLLRELVVVAVGPAVGLAALSTMSTIASDPATFYVGGKATTAGIGPNQVSSILGLGLFLLVLLLLISPRRRLYRLVVVGVGLWFAAQTLLSFSRGGFYTAVGASMVMFLPLMRSRRARWALILGAIVAFGLLRFAILPLTDQLTSGMVSRRITSTTLTGRDKIMEADWLIFLQHPILGVGPGGSYQLHTVTWRASNAHTEYTRLLAEHGVFGLLAMFLLLWMAAERWFDQDTYLARGIGLGLTTWALLYMGHSAIRLVAPALCFGMGGARLLFDRVHQVPARMEVARSPRQGQRARHVPVFTARRMRPGR